MLCGTYCFFFLFLLLGGVQFQLRLQPFTWHPKRQMKKDHRKVFDIS